MKEGCKISYKNIEPQFTKYGCWKMALTFFMTYNKFQRAAEGIYLSSSACQISVLHLQTTGRHINGHWTFYLISSACPLPIFRPSF